MDEHTALLIFGAALTFFGLLQLTNEPYANLTRRIVWRPTRWDRDLNTPKDIKSDRKYHGWTGLIVGIFLLALWLFTR
jgi:hypothetical protein